MIRGNVVKDFNLDSTHIKICDDYCRDKQPGDLQTILDNIAILVENKDGEADGTVLHISPQIPSR